MSGPALPPGYGPRRRRIPPALKLWVGAVIAGIAGLLVSVWSAGRLRAIPATASAETWLFIAYYAAIGVTTIALALWLDEVLFKGAFRRTHLEGKTAETLRPSDDVATVAAVVQRSSVSFPLVLILSGAATYFAFNAVNGGFNFYWRTLGIHLAGLRDDGPEGENRRLQAIAELSIRRAPHDRTLIPRALLAEVDKGGEEAVWAAWALGRFSDLPPRQRQWIHDALLQATRGDDPRITREATIALARLQHRPASEALVRELEADLADRPIDLRLVYSAGWLQTMAAVPALTQVLQSGEVDAQRLAAWSLAQHRDEPGGRAVIKILEDRLPAAPLTVRCAIVHALAITSDEGSNRALIHAFDRATPEERATECPVLDLDLRPDGQGEAARLLEPVDTYEMKILQTMGAVRASSPALRAEVEAWLEGVIAAADPASLLHPRARSLLEGIRSGRDDTVTAPKPAPTR